MSLSSLFRCNLQVYESLILKVLRAVGYHSIGKQIVLVGAGAQFQLDYLYSIFLSDLSLIFKVLGFY